MVGIVLMISAVTIFIPGVYTRRIVDLSYDMDHESMTYPFNPRYNLTIKHAGPYGSVPWLQFGNVEFAAHTGTHVDAPNHFIEGGLQAHQIKMEQLMGPGVVINVKAKVASNIDYRVTDEDLMAWEENHGQIPSGAIVLMNSGWGSRYPDYVRVYNSSSYQEDHSSLHFPGFHESAAQWLVNNRDVHALGVDTPSGDYGQSRTAPVHRIALKERILIIENVANLDKLPESGSFVYLPMIKFRGASGAPARMFAAIEDEGDRTNGASVVISRVWIVGCLIVLSLLMIC